MQKSTQTARRATRRPSVPTRSRRDVAMTSTGLALSLVVAGTSVAAAQAAPTDGSAPVVDTSSLADKARTALSQNAPVAVPSVATWNPQGLEVQVTKFDARAARRAKAEEEARKLREEEERKAELRRQRRSQERSVAASRSSSREAIDEEAEVPTYSGGGTAAAASIAHKYLGVRYVYGGSTPSSGFDCSGLTAYVYRQIGINLPHQSGAQAAYGRRVSSAQAQPGDLVWHPGHVGIYIGNGQMIHAPRPGKSVEIVPVRYNGRNQFYRMG